MINEINIFRVRNICNYITKEKIWNKNLRHIQKNMLFKYINEKMILKKATWILCYEPNAK